MKDYPVESISPSLHLPKDDAPKSLFGYSPGDTCKLCLDVMVESVSLDSITLRVKKVKVDESPPANIREAAERVKNEEKYVTSRVEPSVS